MVSELNCEANMYTNKQMLYFQLPEPYSFDQGKFSGNAQTRGLGPQHLIACESNWKLNHCIISINDTVLVSAGC